MPSVHDIVSEQFYKWERRGRGWDVYAQPVFPEPPFEPFVHRYPPDPSVFDDGCKPTLLSSLVQTLSRKLSTKAPQLPAAVVTEEEPQPQVLVRDSVVELQVSLPEKLDVPDEMFRHFLNNFSLCREPLAFEILGAHKKVTLQFAAASSDAPLVERQLDAYFPEAVFFKGESLLEAALESCVSDQVLAVEFGLKREFMYPLATGNVDPFIGLIGALDGLRARELGLFQVMFQPVEESWQESIIRSVSHSDGRPFFVNTPELTSAAEEKVRAPLFATVVRILLAAASFPRLIQVGRDIGSSLRVFADPHGNSLIPLANEGYPHAAHIEDALRRQSRRTGMLLNVDELAGFVHLPGSEVRSAVLERQRERTKAAPSIVQGQGLLVGTNAHAGEVVDVRLTPEQRVRHCHIIGASGTGKSTLLYNLIRQDIENGEGVAVFDPHGDLIDRILGIIPQSRISDVVLVDPSDSEYSVGFNILSAHSDLEKDLLSSDLVSVFERLSSSWGDQMNSVLQNAISAFLESDRGGTLADLRLFLIEPAFRREFLGSIRDPEIVYYWQKSFPILTGNRSIGSIITRLDTFLAKKPIRHMVSQRVNRLDFGHIMDSGKIFLAKLPEGLLGHGNSYLLGTLLISKFQQITMSRQATQIAARRNYWLYIDEFANFITPTMAEILSGARKYRIGLTLAHHELNQLDRERDVASAVMSHPLTRIVFHVGDDDARKLSTGFSYFEARDISNLETGRAICRVERSDYDFNLAVKLPDEPSDEEAAQRRFEVIDASRKTYGTPIKQVENLARGQLFTASPRDAAPTAEKATPSAPTEVPSPMAPPELKSAQVQNLEVPPSVDVRPEPPPVVPTAETEDNQGLKQRIGKAAEELGYSVQYEAEVPDRGRIDVVLRRGKRIVACEVHAKNATEYEVRNVEKCLKAGFSEVVVVVAKKGKLARVAELIKARIPEQDAAGVRLRLPDEFIQELAAWAKADPEGERIEKSKPHKQKISLSLKHMSEAERLAQEKVMLNELTLAIEGRKKG